MILEKINDLSAIFLEKFADQTETKKALVYL